MLTKRLEADAYIETDFQASGLIGTGLGRYGTSNLPDYTYNQNGNTTPLPEANILLGFYGDPTKTLKLYAYGGAETVMHRRAFDINGIHYGYGNSRYNMNGCNIEGSSICAASSNVKTVVQATTGFWYTAAKGDYGTLRIGGQYLHTGLLRSWGQTSYRC